MLVRQAGGDGSADLPDLIDGGQALRELELGEEGEVGGGGLGLEIGGGEIDGGGFDWGVAGDVESLGFDGGIVEGD